MFIFWKENNWECLFINWVHQSNYQLTMSSFSFLPLENVSPDTHWSSCSNPMSLSINRDLLGKCHRDNELELGLLVPLLYVFNIRLRIKDERNCSSIGYWSSHEALQISHMFSMWWCVSLGWSESSNPIFRIWITGWGSICRTDNHSFCTAGLHKMRSTFDAWVCSHGGVAFSSTSLRNGDGIIRSSRRLWLKKKKKNCLFVLWERLLLS